MTDQAIREAVARAMEPSAFERVGRGYTCQNALVERRFLNAEKTVSRAFRKADAAIAAHIAALEAAGYMIVPLPVGKVT